MQQQMALRRIGFWASAVAFTVANSFHTIGWIAFLITAESLEWCHVPEMTSGSDVIKRIMTHLSPASSCMFGSEWKCWFSFITGQVKKLLLNTLFLFWKSGNWNICRSQKLALVRPTRSHLHKSTMDILHLSERVDQQSVTWMRQCNYQNYWHVLQISHMCESVTCIVNGSWQLAYWTELEIWENMT